jgi:FkbM family methyltransferase
VISRVLEGRLHPTARARLLWHLDRREYGPARVMLRRYLHPGDTVLDVGANWGLMTSRLADRVGPDGRVVAFEPNPGHLPELQRVAQRLPNVTVHPVALSDEPGTLELHVPISPPRRLLGERRVHAMATIAPPSHRPSTAYATVPTAVRRLDDMVDEGLVPADVDFLKCDVEGHELAALRGAERLLRSARPTALIEVEQRHQERPIGEVFAFLQELGYDGQVLHGSDLRPLSEFDVQRDQVAFLRPNALFSAPAPGYLFEFLFTPA